MKKLLIKAYANEWFNMFCVSTALILGYTQLWPGIVFVMSYMLGMAIVMNEKPTTKTTK